ncbi:MAG: O-antigen ligase family protein [Chloroflexi bacterium]|nr:O-antigen ligase family protein [Chloroflexota bacterium]
MNLPSSATGLLDAPDRGTAQGAPPHQGSRPSAPGQKLDGLAAAALVCLAATVGLGDIPTLSPGTTLVSTAVHGLMPLVISLALLNALCARRWPRFPTSLALPFSVWLAVLVASALSAPAYQIEAIAALARPASGALLAWAVYDVCGTQQRWQRVIQALALGGLAVACIAVAEATRIPPIAAGLAAMRDGQVPIGDVPRVAATLSHPNEAAMLFELALPLLVAWAWTAAPRWRRPLGLGALVTLLAIVLTFSRAGIIAALVSLVLLAGLCVRRSARRRLITLGTVALALPLALGWASLMDPGLDRRLLAGIDEASAAQPPRTEFWSAGIGMFEDHPLLGVGPDNFRWLFSAYSATPADNLGIHAHDQYLEVLADTGLLGLVAFSWLIAGLMHLAVQRVHYARADWAWRAALLACLSVWLVHALLDDFERFWPTSVAFWLIVGLLLARPSASRARAID